jgi:hypothetical protein
MWAPDQVVRLIVIIGIILIVGIVAYNVTK